MTNAYTFNEKNNFSKQGINITCKHLESLKSTTQIKNVEQIQKYQKDDIDLLWTYKKGEKEITVPIEVKTDKYKTGNFWLETISNESLQTKGCFLKSKAKYFFYYFIEMNELYIIPLKKAIPWFKENLHRFRESKTTTKDEKGKYKHTTVGRIVPIETMTKEVESILIIKNASKKVQ